MNKYLLTVLIFLLYFNVNGQITLVDTERFPFEPRLSYDESIPTPKSHLGYELGANFTLYAHLVDYFEKLAASSERVLINQYGETYEGRPLINLVISSKENIQNLDQLQEKHMKLMTEVDSKADDIIANEPVFTSFSYNIHGNEASSTEAAMQVAYRMAAAQDEETNKVLDNSVIIMYICINPDGRDRYVYWYTSMRKSQPGYQPQDLEHYAPWPNGRTNHYWFDLNRDWVWGVHPESRGHTAEYQKWMPQVHVDYHEQGYNANYFTMPGTTPRNKQLPDSYESWSSVFGMANVKEFDKNQLSYFTRDRFDFFYPGYGSSYPSVMGAIGMLTEQGGIAAGIVVENDDDYKLTLRQRVFDHYTTSIATVKASAENREELLRYSYQAWRPSNSKIDTKAYLVIANEVYSNNFLEVMLRNKVKIYQAKNDFSLSQAYDYRTGRTIRKNLPEGTFVIPTNQPRSLFITTIMERNMKIEDSVMYDMATWSAPIAYNLEAYSTKGNYNIEMEEITDYPNYSDNVVNESAQYAYVINWNQVNAPKALSMLWRMDYKVRSAYRPFGNDEYNFPAGSLIILKGRNPDKLPSLDSDIKEIAREAKVEIIGFNSGRMTMGMDLANTRNRPLEMPRIALMVEPPFSTYTSGQLYFLFDWVTELPIERIRTSILEQTSMPSFRVRYGKADLKDYDVMVLPGSGNGLKQLFQDNALSKLKDWVKDGGTLVATESSAKFFLKGKSKSGFTNAELKKVPEDSSEAIKYLPYDQREDYFGKKRIPGAALNGKIDITHPLAFGMKDEVYSLKFGTDAILPSDSIQTVGYYHKDAAELLVAGYASQENLSHLAGMTFAGVVPVGEGKIVLLIDNTQYRGFWRGPSRMMQNAVMQVPAY